MSGYPYAEYPLYWTISQDGVGTSYSIVALQGALPSSYFVETLNLKFATASGSPASFDWYLCSDSSGNDALTPLKAGEAWDDINNSTKSYVKGVQRTHKKQTGESLYLAIKVNAGTVNITGYAEGMVIR